MKSFSSCSENPAKTCVGCLFLVKPVRRSTFSPTTRTRELYLDHYPQTLSASRPSSQHAISLRSLLPDLFKSPEHHHRRPSRLQTAKFRSLPPACVCWKSRLLPIHNWYVVGLAVVTPHPHPRLPTQNVYSFSSNHHTSPTSFSIWLSSSEPLLAYDTNILDCKYLTCPAESEQPLPCLPYRQRS